MNNVVNRTANVVAIRRAESVGKACALIIVHTQRAQRTSVHKLINLPCYAVRFVCDALHAAYDVRIAFVCVCDSVRACSLLQQWVNSTTNYWSTHKHNDWTTAAMFNCVHGALTYEPVRDHIACDNKQHSYAICTNACWRRYVLRAVRISVG